MCGCTGNLECYLWEPRHGMAAQVGMLGRPTQYAAVLHMDGGAKTFPILRLEA